MRGRYKRKHQKERYDDRADYGEGLSPLPGEATAGCTPVPGLTVQDAASSGTKKGRTLCSVDNFSVCLFSCVMKLTRRAPKFDLTLLQFFFFFCKRTAV